MTYLSREVLEVKPNWLKSPFEELAYDLRGIRRGFGSSTFAPTASHVARAWSADFTFGTAAEFAAFTGFLMDRSGRLDGFWFPNLALQCRVISGSTAAIFDIKSQNLAVTWTDDACEHLYFVRPDGTAGAAQIFDVTAPSPGIERIEVASTLGGVPDSSWFFYRLLYVRLANDEITATAHCEGVYTLPVKFVELPEEYEAAETGIAPVYLYDFYQDNGDSTLHHWRYTSFAGDITSSGDAFTAFNLTHGSLKQSTRADAQSLKIETVFDADAPWALQLPFPATRPIRLNLYEIDATVPDIRTLYFSGECSGIELDGTDVTLSFDHWFDAMRRQLPGRLIQPRCHYQLGDPLTCKVDLTSFTAPDFQLAITLDSITGNTASVSASQFAASPGDYPTDFFANGRLRVGVPPKIEERMIVASSAASGGGVVLTLSQKLIHQTLPADGLLQRGCDRFLTTCSGVFINAPNFPGFPDVPRVNPTFKAIEIATGTAGKK